MYSTQQQLDLQTFIDSTDRRSVYRQITKMVKKAEKAVHYDLVRRRKRLQQILDEEDTMFEEEFAERVRTRIDRDLERRQKVVDEKKAQQAVEKAEFLQKKLIQRQMEGCYEIRQALRAKDRQIVKETQLEQIIEKEREYVRERNLGEFWRNVRDTNFELFDQKMAAEAELRNQINDDIMCSWADKVQDMQLQHEEQLEIRRQEIKEIDKLIRELKLEEAQIKSGPSPKQVAYGNELARMIKENRERREAEALQEAKEHRELVRTIQREEQEELISIEARKRAFHKSALEYIDFVRRFRKMEENIEKVRDDRIADLRGVDICTQSNLLAEAKRRAEEASRYYAELRRQICDHFERRMREEAEYRQRQMLENRFAREPKSRAEISEERRKIREELDSQIAEMARIRAEEEAEFEKHLRAAFDDPELCTQLAEKYLNEGTDYLAPHPNWRILACPKKEYVPKARVAFVQPKGRPDSCIKPCGCDVISPLAKECYIPHYVMPKLESAKRKY